MTDIREPVRKICRELGLDETFVRRLDLTPGSATVEIYLDRDGKKYLEDGEAATKTLHFKVRA